MYELLKTFFQGLIGFVIFWTCVGAATDRHERVITDAPARAVTAMNADWMGVVEAEPTHWERYSAMIAEPRLYCNGLRESLGGGYEGPPGWPEMYDWPYDEMSARNPVPDAVRDATNKALAELDGLGFYRRLREARQTLRPVRVVPNLDDGMIALLLPELSDSRRTARHAVARARLALERNDEVEFVELSHDIRWLAHAVNQGVLIGSLTSAAIDSLNAREIAFAVREHTLSDATLAALDAILAEADPVAAIRVGLRAERHSQADMVQRCYTDNGNGDGYLAVTNTNAVLFEQEPPLLNEPLRFAGFWAAIPFATRRANDEVFDRMLTEANTMLDAPGIAQMRTGAARRLEESLNWRYPVARIIFPAIARVAVDAHETQATLNATRLIIAIRRHTLAHGQPPATLDALVPAFLPTIPPDTISGKPWVYRKLAQADANGQPFILYSCGTDGIDNGGVHAEEARDRLDSGIGKDYVFNRARD